jgi:2-dehydro-3-deoxy-D-arabinonate dehydratase
MKLYRTRRGTLVEHDDKNYLLVGADWDHLLNHDDVAAHLREEMARVAPLTTAAYPPVGDFLAPIGTQEVWAAGVTYFRSRDARMEEAKKAGGGSFYDRVYSADRPELFFKASPHRVVGSGGLVRIRGDSKWNVPEPELTLAINAHGKIIGFTIGNDMSSRDIEGENPLYLPQAKVYAQSCALGPCILIGDTAPANDTSIGMVIMRAGAEAFRGATTLAQLKRTPEELVGWLFRDNVFPTGCFLLTGTGVVPPDDFTLRPGDEIRITIEPIGTLVNRVE